MLEWAQSRPRGGIAERTPGFWEPRLSVWAAQVCAVPGGREVRATGGERAARQGRWCVWAPGWQQDRKVDEL